MLITQPYKGTILIDHPMRDKLYLMKFKKNIYFLQKLLYTILDKGGVLWKIET